jgi:hypothetical protein
VVNGLLKAAYLVEDLHEAPAERSQPILYLDRRFLTEDRSLQDSEASHLAQPLVHHLRGEAGARSKERAGTVVIRGAQLKESNRPFASDDALDHRGDGDWMFAAGLVVRMVCDVVMNHVVTTLPKGAFFLLGSISRKLAGDEAQTGTSNPTR